MDLLTIVLIVGMIAFFMGIGVNSNFTKNQYKDTRDIDAKFLEASQTQQYYKQSLLNQSEKSVYWHLIKMLGQNYNINPQASLGEILKCNDKFGFRAINSKRSDFVITDKQFKPLAVIEYQGGGHFQSNFSIRDQIKSNALKSAGIAFVQLHDNDLNYIRQTLTKCDFKLNI